VTFRHALTDAQWAMVSIAVPKRRGPAPKLDDRTFIDAVLYRAKTGIPWRDLPERFGRWKTVFNRFSNWSLRGHWATIFKALRIEIDEEGVMIDASVVRAHQDASGGKGGSSVMHWVVLEVASPRSSTRSSTRKVAPSTSSSLRASSTSQRSRKRSSQTTREEKHS
jgi:transposase